MKKSIKNRVRGIINKRSGDNYENLFYNALKSQEIALIGLPATGAKFISKDKYITMPIACDTIIGKFKKTILLDIKSVKSDSFSYSEIHNKKHQIEYLFKFYINGGCYASGFVIFFIKSSNVYFFHSEYLYNIKPRHSVKMKYGILLGTIDNFSVLPLFFKL